jgi:hypothetical protein
MGRGHEVETRSQRCMHGESHCLVRVYKYSEYSDGVRSPGVLRTPD